VKNLRAIDSVELGSLSFLWLELTGKCNLECVHCYADSGPRHPLIDQMKTSDWTRLIEEAAHIGCKTLQFIGGEPTLHPDLGQLCAIARDLGIREIEVFTNATRLDETLLDCFRDHKVGVASSFYSCDPNTHDLITGRPRSWAKTVRGFHKVIAAGIPLRVGVIEMDQNRAHCDEALGFLRSIGVRRVRVDRIRGVGRGLVQVTCCGEEDSPFDQLCGQCWKGRLCVDPSGMAYPCVMARRWPIADVRDGLAKVLASASLAHFRDEFRDRQRDPAALAVPQRSGRAGCSPDDDSDCYPNSSCGPDECNPVEGCSPNEPGIDG
jgi:uncharacterized Fe-S cluster-containing radical SAM superfamily protein